MDFFIRATDSIGGQIRRCAYIARVLSRRAQKILIHTDQHDDHTQSRVFFDELAIPKSNYNPGIGSGGRGKQTGQMLIAIEEVLLL